MSRAKDLNLTTSIMTAAQKKDRRQFPPENHADRHR
jgi:hypothetical protein